MSSLEPENDDPLSRYLREELAAMTSGWMALLNTPTPPPAWTWEDIKEALLGMTTCPAEELVIRGALSGLVKQAKFKPSSLVLDEVLRLAIAAHDLGFRGSVRQMLEAEMP